MIRKSISFPDQLYKHLQKIRGKRIATSGEGLPFQKLVVDLVQLGIKYSVEVEEQKKWYDELWKEKKE